MDEIHPDFPKSGGPFDSRAVTVEFADQGCTTGYDRTVSGYRNSYLFVGNRRIPPIYNNTSLPASRMSYAESQGPTAWSRFAPGRPKVGLNQFLGELRDFPSLFQVGLRRFKDLGKLYLNAQFGWRPFLSDIMSTLKTLEKIDLRIAQLRNEQRKWVKRGGTLYQTSNVVTTASSYGPWPGNYIVDGKSTITTTTVTHCWFSGRFRYYINGLDDPRWGRFRAIRRIFGLELSPSLLWQLCPYSWLADWCANAGSVIQNLERTLADHLTAKYAYVMLQEETTQEVVATGRGQYLKGDWSTPWSYFPISVSGKHKSSTKTRCAASPFGFGLTWDGFDAFQLSILAALGLSRFRS
jgi:hypothetical protein